MDKTLQKVVTKDPKRLEAARKGREKYMNKLKESTLNYAKEGGGDTTNVSNETPSPTSNGSNSTINSTSNASNEITGAINTVSAPATSTNNTATTTRSNDTYCLWQWYACDPCHWCLCIFCI